MALTDKTNPMQGVSGPGKFAKRTDLEFQPQAYGEGVEMKNIKAGAKLAKAPATPGAARTTLPAAEPVTPLFAPTERPDEPATHGVNIGDGGDASVLQMRQPDDTNFRAAIQSAKPVLGYIADLPNISPETRAAIKQLWDM